MATIAGLRGSGDWGTDERPKTFRELILWQQPNGRAPIFALTGKLKKEALVDPEFSWWEEQLTALRVQSSTTIASGITALVLKASTAAVGVPGNLMTGQGGFGDLVAGDLLLVEQANGVGADGATAYTNEIVKVTATPTSTTVTISRGYAGTTAASIAANAYLLKIGNVFQEGSGSPDTSTRNPTKFMNYAQIFKTAYDITNTAKGISNIRTGNTLKNDKKRKAFDHAVALEFSLLFGVPAENVSGAQPERATGGLMHFLSQAGRVNVFSAGLTADTFFDNIYDVFDYESIGGAGDERICFCGNGALNALNKMAAGADNTQIMHKEVVKLYGMNLTKWVTPQGTFYFKSHPLFNIHPQFTNSIIITDPTGIRYRPFRDTKEENNIQLPDADLEKGQWLTEAGFEFHGMNCFKYLGNVTAA